MNWLEWNHPEVYLRYVNDPRPDFTGTTNVAYFLELIRGFKQYFDEEQFIKIVGIRLSSYLA